MRIAGITKSFPPPNEQSLSPEDWDWFQQLPAEYMEFLTAHNGGFVEEFQYSFLTGVPFKTETVSNPSRSDCPVEFFGIPTVSDVEGFADDVIQRAVDHEAEEFLPHDVIAIARCVQNSLVCLVTAGPERGAIYYWHWYWKYPWCKPFFDERIHLVTTQYPNAKEILNRPDHEKYREVFDAFNYATLVKIAPSLNAWLSACRDAREGE